MHHPFWRETRKSQRKPTKYKVIISGINEKERESARRGSAVMSCKIRVSVTASFVDDSRSQKAILTNQCKLFVSDRKSEQDHGKQGVRSMHASLGRSSDQCRHWVISDRGRIEKSKYQLDICQSTLKNENRTRNQEISSSCACRHVIWIRRSHGLSAISGEDYASHANHATRVMSGILGRWVGVKVDSYEVPGGLDASPWAWPACCCWASAWYHSAT